MTACLTDPNILEALQRASADQLHLLKAPAETWQPADLTGELTGGSWQDAVLEIRREAEPLPADALACLAGSLITEEALPSYQAWLNRHLEFRDETGTDTTPWAQWTRAWSAEENRHGDVLNRYLYLSGRADMRAVELTIHHLIRNGFNLGSGSHVYKSIVYASFQERATRISHRNMGLLAHEHGAKKLGRICALIAGDEARHEQAYQNLFKVCLSADPDQAVTAMGEMLLSKIVMPARLMSDGTGRDLFSDYSILAQRLGIYTTRDYAETLLFLAETWGLAKLRGLSAEASAALEKIFKTAEKYQRKSAQIAEALGSVEVQAFSWIRPTPP
ncbi:MAG: acyl-ACP desaturase [Candidatus Omnitrophica bacterium]|nr:acyl-ACP desaturase [Candidatus Omnitrophota bacterium]